MSQSVVTEKTERQALTVRAAAAVLMLAAATWYFAQELHQVRPFKSWLIFDLARLWGWEVLLTLGCLSTGHWLVSRFRLDLPLLEKVALSLPLGLVAFVVGIYALGYVGLLGWGFAVLQPCAFVLLGARSSLSLYREVERAYTERTPWSVQALAAAGFGVLGVSVIYLSALSPDAINYDSSWNHLVIAQDYAREGRIVGFPGDWVKNVPHLGSVVNTWSMLVPGHRVPALQWMQAQHTELTVFLWTLVGVAAGARHLAERAALKGAWAAFFLFPSIFVYDGNLGCAADHFLALFAVPALLSGFRFAGRPRMGEGVVFGALVGGALLTKAQAVYFLVPLCAVIGARLVSGAWRARSEPSSPHALKSSARALGVAAAVAGALCLLHYGKNAVIFGNPFFPLSQARFPSKLSQVPDAQQQMDYLFADWHAHPAKQATERVKNALVALFDFSFSPHYTFVGNLPTFGSLFTLLTPLALIVPRAKRLGAALLVGYGALLVWGLTFPVDRNLQTFLPLLVSVTAALLARGWELGVLARLALVPIVGLQLVWGFEWWFSGIDRFNAGIGLIRASAEGGVRFERYRRDYVELGRSLPTKANVLLHNNHVMLGIDRPVITDLMGFQGLVDYRRFKSPRDVDARFRELAISHVVWTPGSSPAMTQQEEVLFAIYATRYLEPRRFGSLHLAPLPAEPPPEHAPYRVAVAGLSTYATGLFQIEDLGVCEQMPPEMRHYPAPRAPATNATFSAVLEQADAVLVGSAHLPDRAKDMLSEDFEAARYAAGVSVYFRKN